jgi:hypothetical protein
MLKRTPIYAALAAVGLCASGGAMAGATTTVPTLGELCGTTISEDTEAYCDGASETLVNDCDITVAPGKNLMITYCKVDADNHRLYIAGAPYAQLEMRGSSGNSAISNASNIFLNFHGSNSADPYNCLENDVIDLDSYDMSAITPVPGGRRGNIYMGVRQCGSIRIDNSTDFWAANHYADSSFQAMVSYGKVSIINLDPDFSLPGITTPGIIDVRAPNGNVMISGFKLDATDISVMGGGNGGAVVN